MSETSSGQGVPVTLIAAVAQNGVIGNGNAIPWRLPSDFAHFKRVTMGKPLIMGRKTFESIGRPLPGRINIVVSRQSGYRPDGVLVTDSFESALAHARSIAQAEGVSEVMVGGGGAIYAEAMALADRLLITHVELSPDGDAVFPPIDPETWEVAEAIDNPKSAADTAAYSIKLYRRRGDARR